MNGLSPSYPPLLLIIESAKRRLSCPELQSLMRKRAADIEAEPALIDGASYSLHLRFIRAAFSTGTVVASSPAREGGFRMGSRYVTLDRTWLPNGSTHDSTAFLHQIH